MNTMPAGPELSLSVQTGTGIPACPVSRPRLRRWVLAALQGDARITLRFVASREARALNREHRGRDYATNVLTFTYDGPPLAAMPDGRRARQSAGAARACAEADIVICLPVVRAEARTQRKPFDHHLAHMVIHGVLHAQGFDHEDDVEAAGMEALEAALLKRFRIPDPYADERNATR